MSSSQLLSSGRNVQVGEQHAPPSHSSPASTSLSPHAAHAGDATKSNLAKTQAEATSVVVNVP
jgi:hypothetical protein